MCSRPSMICRRWPLYLTARKLNVKYLPFPWYVTPQIPAVMGSSRIPPAGSLSSLLFSLFSMSSQSGSDFEHGQRLTHRPKSAWWSILTRNMSRCRPTWPLPALRVLFIHPVVLLVLLLIHQTAITADYFLQRTGSDAFSLVDNLENGGCSSGGKLGHLPVHDWRISQ